MSPPKKKTTGGYARIKAKGLRPFMLSLTAEQHEQIRKAAESDGRSMTQFLIFHGIKAAEKINAKNQ